MAEEWTPYAIERPTPQLLRYYLFVSLLTLPAFPVVFLPLYFKYHTLRYHFDDEGVKMSWGILFRREIFLTYGRIQDIHVTRDVLERWMGLAKVGVQTASGSARPEMTIVGIAEFDALRDFLYRQMRGARHETEDAAQAQTEELATLRDIRDHLAAAATALERAGGRRDG